MKNICLLGATGSIGQSTLDIIKANPDKYCLKAFSFCHNINKAKEIIKEYHPVLVSTPIVEHIDALKKEFPNLITAGRSASAEGFAWDVLRVIPPAIITGQAAGVAAAVAVDEEKPLCDIDIKVVQNILEKQNVMIHFDDSLVPQNKGESGEAVDLGHIE